MNRFFNYIFAPARTAAASPVATHTTLVVAPNGRGGWGLRWEDDTEPALGNYATQVDALRAARANYAHVRIVDDESAQLGRRDSQLETPLAAPAAPSVA